MNLDLTSPRRNLAKFTQEAKIILQNQTIDETSPGTIIQDFNTFLNLVKEDGIQVSGKLSLFPIKLLSELNSYFTNPSLTDLKRPVQKSYPYLNGIYLLLRSTGLTYIQNQGKKQKLVLDEITYQSWKKLNFTEQYLTLLEAWLIHSRSETLGESSHLSNLSLCTLFWERLDKDKVKITKKNQNKFYFNQLPRFYNLALLDLFGFIELQQDKPEPDKGWRITGIEKKVLGQTMLALIMHSLLSANIPLHAYDLVDQIEGEQTLEFGRLQKYFQPYFPQWQNNLVVHQEQTSEGLFIFKVSLRKCWRKIAIASQLNLDDLAEIILKAFDFDCDHLYQFICKQRTGAILNINHPYLEEEPTTDEYTVGKLPLQKGEAMIFLFDFGDHWEFEVILEEIKLPNQKTKHPQILESHGQAPEQYPDWDDWTEE